MKKLLLVAVIFAAQAVFAKPMKMGTFPIPMMVESPEKGLFVELTKEIAKRAGIQIEIVVNPPNRITDQFAKGEVDGLFPGLDVTMPKTPAKSAPIYFKTDFIFYKKSEPFKTLKELEGKPVGITVGYPYDKSVTENKAIKIDQGPDDVTNMKKLGAGRIKGFIVEEKTGLKALEQSGEKEIAYSPDSPVSKQEVYYAFQNTAEGKAAAEKFSKAIVEMQKDGTFGKIMAPAK